MKSSKRPRLSTQASTRAYHSPLRRHQSQTTRDLIVEAFARQVAEEGVRDFTIPQVAKRAGVSLPTVWRYFPTRESLADAVEAWLNPARELPAPLNTAEFRPYIERLFRFFEEQAPLVLAVIYWRFSAKMAVEGRVGRVRAYGEALREATTHLPDDEAKRARAMVAFLISVLAWKTLKEESNLSGPEAAESVAWAVETLIADLSRRNVAARQAASAQESKA